jgi:nucleoside-diphosphate-sugar epimerase
VKHSFADIFLARRVLGYEPRVDFETGIAHTFESLRAEVRGEQT